MSSFNDASAAPGDPARILLPGWIAGPLRGDRI